MALHVTGSVFSKRSAYHALALIQNYSLCNVCFYFFKPVSLKESQTKLVSVILSVEDKIEAETAVKNGDGWSMAVRRGY